MGEIVELKTYEDALHHTRHSGWCTGRADTAQFWTDYITAGWLFVYYKDGRRRPSYQMFFPRQSPAQQVFDVRMNASCSRITIPTVKQFELKHVGNKSVDIDKIKTECPDMCVFIESRLGKNEFAAWCELQQKVNESIGFLNDLVMNSRRRTVGFDPAHGDSHGFMSWIQSELDRDMDSRRVPLEPQRFDNFVVLNDELITISDPDEIEVLWDGYQRAWFRHKAETHWQYLSRETPRGSILEHRYGIELPFVRDVRMDTRREVVTYRLMDGQTIGLMVHQNSLGIFSRDPTRFAPVTARWETIVHFGGHVALELQHEANVILGGNPNNIKRRAMQDALKIFHVNILNRFHGKPPRTTPASRHDSP